MASPAPLIKWPPNYPDEFRRRAAMLERIGESKADREKMMIYWSKNPVDWIEDCCVTYDPRLPTNPKTIPFMLFPRQVDFIYFLLDCLRTKQPGLVEKCRDVGASWLACAFSAWLWIFHPGEAVGWGSRKEDYVDKKGDPKAIFPKIRMILDALPAWQLPPFFDVNLNTAHMRIINPDNGSSITGEAGDNMGRGGRTSIYFKDESAHYEHPEAIEAALGDNTDVQIDISSVNGTANPFYHRRQAGEIWTRDHKIPLGVTRVFIFDWLDHPAKTQEWYDRRRKRAMAEGLGHIFAQEVDRDYSSAVQGIIIRPEWVRACIDAHIKLKNLGNWLEGEKVAGFDPYDEGKDKHALVARKGVVISLADQWTEGDGGQATRLVISECKRRGIYEIYYDAIGVGAACKSEFNRMVEDGLIPEGMRFMPWRASDPPLEADKNVIPGDRDSPTNDDVYASLKAQAYIRLGIRCEKTYKAVTQGEIYPIEELISIPSGLKRLQELINQLCQPTRTIGTNGKIKVDKAPDGSSSPNLADATVECYNPTRKLSILDVL